VINAKSEFKRVVLLAASAGFLFALPQNIVAGTKPVMAHYMPWYVAPPTSGSWGWHWTMNHFNPNLLNTNGQRQVASWYYPLIGPYDSADPVVLEYHVLLMKLAGIDGVIVDWYGMDNYNDYAVNNQRTLALFNYTRKAGLKFSLCYEDQTIQHEIDGGFITAAGAVAHAQQTLLYAQTNFFADPSYLRLNNAPVLLNFGPQYFKTNADWVTIFSVLNSTNQPAFFTEDNRLASGTGAFDWPPMWMSGGGTNILTPSQLQSYLNSFDQKAAGWPAFISSAFPRFHDIYAQAGVGTSYGYLDDADGANFTNTLTRAMTNHSAVVQLVTWNDFGEGTILEPTQDYGYRDLGIVQAARRYYLNPAFPYRTNDLGLAVRLYSLRRQYTNAPAISGELERVFTNVVAGATATANWQLTGLESGRPVVYNISHDGQQLRFCIGGYVASTLQVQVSTDLASWQTVQSYAASSNLVAFSTNTTPAVSSFFRVRY
jgi:hypothetical protein